MKCFGTMHRFIASMHRRFKEQNIFVMKKWIFFFYYGEDYSDSTVAGEDLQPSPGMESKWSQSCLRQRTGLGKIRSWEVSGSRALLILGVGTCMFACLHVRQHGFCMCLCVCARTYIYVCMCISCMLAFTSACFFARRHLHAVCPEKLFDMTSFKLIC